MDFRLLISYELELDEPVETEKHSDLRHFLQGPREEEEKQTHKKTVKAHAGEDGREKSRRTAAEGMERSRERGNGGRAT